MFRMLTEVRAQRAGRPQVVRFTVMSPLVWWWQKTDNLSVHQHFFHLGNCIPTTTAIGHNTQMATSTMMLSTFRLRVSFLGSWVVFLFHASSCQASMTYTEMSNVQGVIPPNLATFVRGQKLNSVLSQDSDPIKPGVLRRVEASELAPTPPPTTEPTVPAASTPSPSQGKTKTSLRELWADTHLEISNATDLMGTSEKGTFEMTALRLLQSEYGFDNEYYLDFLEVHVRGQAFLYPEEHEYLETRIGNLTVFFNVSAIVFPAKTEGIHFQDSVESFFETHKSTFLDLLVDNDSFFKPASIQTTASNPGTSDRETEDDSWTDIFSTPVIIGVSVGMAFVALVGMFVISRLVQKDDDSLPGHNGAGRSDEDASIQELSVHDDQAIFMSFSHASKAVSTMKIPEFARRDDATTAGNTQGSVHTNSTNGSHLAGLDIENVGSNSSMGGSVSKGTVAAYSTSTASRLGGNSWHPGTPVSAQHCDEIRQRSRNILDDTDSLVGVQTGSMESDMSGASTTNQVHYGAPSVNLARARENKRRLEQCLKDSKRRTHDTSTGADTASTNSVSLQDLVKASSRWTRGASNDNDARSHLASHSSHPGTGIGSADSKEELGKAEMVALAEIIPVQDPTPRNVDDGTQKRPVYENVCDIPGVVIDAVEDRDDIASSIRGGNNVLSAKTSSWRSFATPPRHENNNKINARRLPDRRVWSAGSASILRKTLFGKKGNSLGESEETNNRFLTPSQRYRLSNQGHLVPRRLTEQMASPIAESSPGSQVSSLGGEDSHLLGITPQKFRPPQLDINHLDDETVHDETEELAERDNVETPLAVHPLPSTLHAALLDSSRGRLSFHTKSPSAHTIYGQGMIFGQDPDGFTLSSYYSKGLVGGSEGRPSYCDPPPVVTTQKDPPTATEYRSKSQKKGRSNTMELAVADREDVVILGSIRKGTKAEMELEWANMI
eukprot:Nitzschia sp. Nitz4//scaffold52_size167869//65084//68010//NITZ4_002273-RA/size167869-snap-gene-0.224-mRNA-1//-1//CDS//3329554026//4294//frame0